MIRICKFRNRYDLDRNYSDNYHGYRYRDLGHHESRNGSYHYKDDADLVSDYDKMKRK